MADAAERAEFERLQAEEKRLRAELAAWPAVSAERSAAQASVDALQAELEQIGRELPALREQEAMARSKRGETWWRLPFVPALIAIGALAAICYVPTLVDRIDWYRVAPVVWPFLLATPPALVVARIAIALRGLWRRGRGAGGR